LEPLSGTITSVGELVPEQHRTSRGQSQNQNPIPTSEVPMEEDEDKGSKRIKTTVEDWENDQVRSF
jgi:hypothetical protein